MCREGNAFRTMPAPVLVVHSERDARELIMSVLQAAGHEAAAFADPIAALDVILAGSRVRVLVTQDDFGPGKLNGINLSLMLKVKGAGVKTVLVGEPENQVHAEDVAPFIPHPIDTGLLAETVSRLLAQSLG